MRAASKHLRNLSSLVPMDPELDPSVFEELMYSPGKRFDVK